MHPLDIFKFCPKCGSKEFAINSSISKKCEKCGFEYFKNPTIGVSALVFNNENQILCLTREKNPGKGMLGLPGGFVDLNETIEEAIIRETKEETGIDIELIEFIGNIPNSYIYSGFETNPLDFYFLAKAKDTKNMKPQKGETSNLRFLDLKDISIESFAMISTQKILKMYLSKFK